MDKTKRRGGVGRGGTLLKTILFAGCLSFGVFAQWGVTPPVPLAGRPDIRINTDGGVPILNREDWVTMTFSLENAGNPAHNIQAIGNQQIRGRGNSSWNAAWNRPPQYPVAGYNPYRIRFRNNQQQGLFGHPEARNWVLLNSDPEKNAFAFEMGQRLDLQYTCTYQPVNVHLNGTYLGNYILTEHRQADPAGIGAPGRPKIHPDNGWFVEIDRLFPRDEPLKFLTGNYDLPVIVKSPAVDEEDIDNPRYDFVRNDLNKLADTMASINFPENGFRDMVDLETFIKYFIVQTFIQNVDLFRTDRPTIDTTRARRDTSVTIDHIGSVFLYKADNGKISAGPLWDLNWSFPTLNTGNFGRMGPTLYPYMTHQWFNRFFDDPEFLVRYKEIWNEYRDQIESMREFITDICNRVYGSNNNTQRTSMTTFFNARLAFLNTEYNKVNVRPLARHFGTRGRNYAEAPPRTVTLVSYGEMTGLTASLQKGASSEFEIISGPAQTATGKGGHLAAVNIRPKNALSIATYRDTLILSGTKQGETFSFRVPLDFTVSGEIEQVSVLSYDRTIPQDIKTTENTAVVVPSSLPSAHFTAGPNPVNRNGGIVNFFWNGKQLRDGMLTVFDVSGNVVNRISINDPVAVGNRGRRSVGSWNLTDRHGRPVSSGAYLVRGSITTSDGKRERISTMVMVGVR